MSKELIERITRVLQAIARQELDTDETARTLRACSDALVKQAEEIDELADLLLTECERTSVYEERVKALEGLGSEIVEINTANGWNVTTPGTWTDANVYRIPAILGLIHSEVSEALEAFRKNNKENFAEEMADVLIRVLDCTHGLGIDMDKSVRDKLEKNRKRGFRHGGKTV